MAQKPTKEPDRTVAPTAGSEKKSATAKPSRIAKKAHQRGKTRADSPAGEDAAADETARPAEDQRTTKGTVETPVKSPRKRTRRGTRGGQKRKRAGTTSDQAAPPSAHTATVEPKLRVTAAPPAGEAMPSTPTDAASEMAKPSGKRRPRRRQSVAARAPLDESTPVDTSGERTAPQPFGFGIGVSPEAPATVPAAVESPATVTTEAPPATSDSTARLVLKQRPARRSRRSRKHRRPSTGKEEQAAIAEEPAPAEASQAPKDDAPPSKRKAPKRAPRKRKRTERPPADQKTASPIIGVLDESHGPHVPLAEGREMIINVTAGAECRIAILHQGKLEELYIERQSAVSHVGNIYMGRVTNVEPSIQAAFIDFGLVKNGFLHISDVQPKYFPNGTGASEPVGKKVPRRDRPPIQKCFRRGDTVIAQIIKEGVGTKGPTLTTYLSIPGRFVVMMPGMNKLGVSRKIEDELDRRAMRELLGQLTLPEGVGFILRTAGLHRTKRELQSDLNYLNRLWKTVTARIAEQSLPCELYQESDLVIRTIRDIYSSDFKRIVVDDSRTARKARDFLRIAMPRSPGTVVEYQRHEPVFHYYQIEEEIQRLHARHVPLPSGGSIVIESTEAMVTIDVNSGKFRDPKDAEETAYRINLEAAEEIARQLRLRDLGGLVVCDFIDLRLDRHKRAVEKALRDALRKHKERARILRMSQFGLIEMTRQRQRPSIKRSVFVDCPHCNGGGLVKTPESMSLEVTRILQLLAHRAEVNRITVTAAPQVSSLVLNDRRAFLHDLERKADKVITIVPDPTFAHDQVSYECADHRGMPLRIEV